MNLTKQLRAMIVERFEDGFSIPEIATWYKKDQYAIENVIRDYIRGNRHALKQEN